MTPDQTSIVDWIKTKHENATVDVIPAGGGAVVEIIVPDITPEDAVSLSLWVAKQPVAYNQNLPEDERLSHGIHIHRLLIYGNKSERFTELASLRTRPTRSNGTFHSTTDSASDAVLLVREADLEAMTLGVRFPYTCTAMPRFENAPPSPDSINYIELDVGGLSLAVEDVKSVGNKLWTIEISREIR